jgi:beta-galactosidase
MSNNHSYSMYMVHGGSNFGLTAGANAFTGQAYDYRGHVTSYDYDAPINEQGSSTPKYQSLKTLIKKYVNWTVPAEPSAITMIEIPRFRLTPVGSMLSNLGSPAITGSKVTHLY